MRALQQQCNGHLTARYLELPQGGGYSQGILVLSQAERAWGFGGCPRRHGAYYVANAEEVERMRRVMDAHSASVHTLNPNAAAAAQVLINRADRGHDSRNNITTIVEPFLVVAGFRDRESPPQIFS